MMLSIHLFIYGIEKFAKDISGTIDAVICVDLPSDVVEEKQLNDALKKENIVKRDKHGTC